MAQAIRIDLPANQSRQYRPTASRVGQRHPRFEVCHRRAPNVHNAGRTNLKSPRRGPKSGALGLGPYIYGDRDLLPSNLSGQPCRRALRGAVSGAGIGHRLRPTVGTPSQTVFKKPVERRSAETGTHVDPYVDGQPCHVCCWLNWVVVGDKRKCWLVSANGDLVGRRDLPDGATVVDPDVDDRSPAMPT